MRLRCRKNWCFTAVSSLLILLILHLTIRSQEDKDAVSHSLFRLINAIEPEFASAAAWQRTAQSEMERRKMAIRRICKQEALGHFASPNLRQKVPYPPVPNYEAFYFDRKYKLAWCPIYKAATTSWLYNFCVLSGVKEEMLSNVTISAIARRCSPSLDFIEGTKAMNESAMKFFIVRHPFERLLSAYRDKLEDKDIGHKHGTLHFYQRFGKNIMKKYRKTENVSFVAGGGLESTPEERRTPLEPTFKEFVLYLLDLDLAVKADDHWIPFYVYCTPCSIDYDVVAKFETLARDQKYIISRSKLESKIQPHWKHKTRLSESSSVVEKYFSVLSRNQIYRLYQKYKIDFEMFDYSVDEYLQFAKS